MAEYIMIYRATPEAERAAMGTPEAAKKSMAKWTAWMNEMGQKGVLKDAGMPLELTGKVVRSRSRTPTDGPFIEAKEIVGGFSIVEARDLAHAAEIAAGCPILDGDGSVEVRPVVRL